MLCTNQDLIKISNISKRTFYRRLKEFKLNNECKRINGYFYTSSTAYSIAKYMGFEDTFKMYHLKTLQRTIIQAA